MTHMSRDDLPALCKPGFTGRAWAPGPRRQLARASLRKQLTILDYIDYYGCAYGCSSFQSQSAASVRSMDTVVNRVLNQSASGYK